MGDFPLGRVPPVRLRPEFPAAAQRAARQLESAFAAELLKAARPKSQDGMFTGGIGAHTFDSFMDEALGEAMTRNGELGLAPHIARSLARAMGGAGGNNTAAPPVAGALPSRPVAPSPTPTPGGVVARAR